MVGSVLKSIIVGETVLFFGAFYIWKKLSNERGNEFPFEHFYKTYTIIMLKYFIVFVLVFEVVIV